MCLLLSRHVCNVMSWVKRSELSCGRTVLQYCCCLIATLTAWIKLVPENQSSEWGKMAVSSFLQRLKRVTSIFKAQNYYILPI